jgi:hypothetical protein
VIERMRLRADAMTTRAADLKKLADASEPLYKSLTDNQKRRLVGMMRNASAFAQQDGRRFGDGRRGDRGPRFSHHNDRGRYGDRDRYVR